MVQAFRAQLGLICVQEIQVWLYLLVQDIHEQCKFLNRMDFSAIFQQINLTISMSYMSFCNFNSKSDGYDFFPFKYSSSLSTSESRAKTPRLLQVFLRPPTKFQQSLVFFSAGPCKPCSWKIEIFLFYGGIFLPNTQGPLGCLLGFWPSGPQPCGANNSYV